MAKAETSKAEAITNRKQYFSMVCSMSKCGCGGKTNPSSQVRPPQANGVIPNIVIVTRQRSAKVTISLYRPVRITSEIMEKAGFVIREAGSGDIGELIRVINAAFSVEKFFIERDRIDAQEVMDYMSKGRFLLAEDAAGVAACIYLELRGDHGYFGLLSVDPTRQKTG